MALTLRKELEPFEAAYVDAVRTSLARGGASEERTAAAADYATNLLSNGFPPLFDHLHLATVLELGMPELRTMADVAEAHYESFRLRKRDGGSRLIEAPTRGLKRVQHWIMRYVTKSLWAHDACHGFRPGRSIVSNARPHVGQALIVKYDLRDFFGTVSRSRVFRIFRRIGYAVPVADLLTSLVTIDDRLPQGAPTSPDLANHVAYELDARLSSLGKSNGFIYTRYADDLTFSGEGIEESRTRRAIKVIIRDCGFSPNEAKERFLTPATRQQITGVVVNEKVNVPRWHRRWLRQELYYLERFGVDGHLKHRGSEAARYKDFIYGHVLALNAVSPDLARDYLDRLDRLEWPY